VCHALKDNVCDVLNNVLDCTYSRASVAAPGIPDFNCFENEKLILVIEVKRNHLLKDMGNQTLSEFYRKDSKAKTIVQQIYNYMSGNESQFGILTTYEGHWFMWRPKETPMKVFISHTLLLQSVSPPVLKAWAYLVQCAEKDCHSPHALLVNVKSESNPSQGTRHNYNLRDRTSLKSHSMGTSSKTSHNFREKGRELHDMQTFDYNDFKFESILGIGRSGKTLMCMFYGQRIALKTTDLSKTPEFLPEMQNEVHVYQYLRQIHTKFSML